MSHSALAGRRVFLTGHTGFKGSWMALWLTQLGAEVHGYALAPPTTPSHFQAAGVEELLAGHTEADLRDEASLRQAFEAADPEVVLHFAAQSLVRKSYGSPRETFEINVIGTAAVLDLVRERAKPCAVLCITSDKCYENREQVWAYRECDPMGGYDPYSASKGAAELLINSYRRSFFPPEKLEEHGVRLASARAGNVIGGGDWAADRIVVDVVSHLATGRQVPVRSPYAVRPWQHVLDPLSGYLELVSRMLESPRDAQWCEGWNFGPGTGEERIVRDLVEKMISNWGSGTWQDVSRGSHPHEARLLRLATEKASVQLGWHARWGFDEAVRRTAAWYRAFYNEGGRGARALTLGDIAAYTEGL